MNGSVNRCPGAAAAASYTPAFEMHVLDLLTYCRIIVATKVRDIFHYEAPAM